MAQSDPFRGYNFKVEIDGITSTAFKECSGLDSTVAVVEYREGTDPTLNKRKLPGLASAANITLRRGITSDRSLWDWQNKVSSGDLTRRDLSIILMNDKGEEEIRWNLLNAWPTRWTGPAFDAASDAIAIEALELTNEGIEVQTWKQQ